MSGTKRTTGGFTGGLGRASFVAMAEENGTGSRSSAENGKRDDHVMMNEFELDSWAPRTAWGHPPLRLPHDCLSHGPSVRLTNEPMPPGRR